MIVVVFRTPFNFVVVVFLFSILAYAHTLIYIYNATFLLNELSLRNILVYYCIKINNQNQHKLFNIMI